MFKVTNPCLDVIVLVGSIYLVDELNVLNLKYYLLQLLLQS